MTDQFRGGLAVFSGPSGSGKTSICRSLLEDPRLQLSVSATTRPPREGEVHGTDYWFYDEPTFRRMIDEGRFVEWAEVYGRLYGTPEAPLRAAAGQRDRTLLLDIDVQGAAQLRDRGIEGLFVFIAPPSLDELRHRLVSRGTDAPEVIERRLTFAAGEMKRQDLYDHVLVNEDLSATIEAARSLLGL